MSMINFNAIAQALTEYEFDELEATFLILIEEIKEREELSEERYQALLDICCYYTRRYKRDNQLYNCLPTLKVLESN